jgi:hypothetical protein
VERLKLLIGDDDLSEAVTTLAQFLLIIPLDAEHQHEDDEAIRHIKQLQQLKDPIQREVR